jgi:hypothetical protein
MFTLSDFTETNEKKINEEESKQQNCRKREKNYINHSNPKWKHPIDFLAPVVAKIWKNERLMRT